MGPKKLVVKNLENGEAYYYDIIAQGPSDPRLGTMDGFARVRLAEPTVLFDSTMEYTSHEHLWTTYASGLVSSGLNPNCYLDMYTSGIGRMVRQSWQYQRYQPGKSQLVLMTGTLGPMTVGVTKRIGYFDDLNGLFFQCDGMELAVVKRSNGQDTIYSQNSWNVNKCDGSLGFTLDHEKAQIFMIDFEWLGVGQIRFGFFIGGQPLICHIIDNSNIISQPYMATANLPPRYEISSINPIGISWMRQICTSIISEGGIQKAGGGQCSVYTPSTGVSCSQDAWTTVLAIRPRPTFGAFGAINRSLSIPEQASVAVTAGPTIIYMRILYAECATSHGTWTSPITGAGLLQGATDVTVFTALNPVYSTVIAATAGQGNKSDASIAGQAQLLLPFSYNYDGSRVRIYLIQVFPVGAGCTAHATASQYGLF
jgi:hypothetical protein